MTQETAHMPLDERAVAEACQAAAIEMARQVGVTLTPAGYRQGAADRPVEQSQMVEYMKAAIRAYIQTAAADVSGLVERLEKRAAEDDECADNNRVVADLLSPELAKFNERVDGGWNTYAVRMAVDHRGSMERDRRYATDLRQTISTLQTLSASNAALEAENQWQPIDTAPKDGSRVLLWAPDYCSYPVTGEWCERVGAWDAECGMMEEGPALYEDECAGPSHWRHLPAPPAALSAPKGGQDD